MRRRMLSIRCGTLPGMTKPPPQTCRWQTVLYATADCALPPAAKLQSNVFGTHYELILDPSVGPFEGPGATDASGRAFGKAGSLMDVQYKTRLKGFMRPRRCILPPLKTCWPSTCPTVLCKPVVQIALSILLAVCCPCVSAACHPEGFQVIAHLPSTRLHLRVNSDGCACPIQLLCYVQPLSSRIWPPLALLRSNLLRSEWLNGVFVNKARFKMPCCHAECGWGCLARLRWSASPPGPA